MARDKPENLCPYWSMQTMKCQLCRHGLFIPLNDHIETYCQTLHFPQCPQYRLYSPEQPPPENNGRNRRKYQRVTTSHLVTLVRLAEAEPVAPQLFAARRAAIRGTTLDLGKGGMRLVVDQFLAQTTPIRFSFENSFPASIQSGKGHVAWCHERANGSGFKAGICFQDHRLVETMGLYLGFITVIPPAAD